ncbi:MAG: hypothetical protein HOP18_22145 [Deltaproteobacteria bacterium]|nr:hypothetical protein [Deltaproteobacteria bacterium]
MVHARWYSRITVGVVMTSCLLLSGCSEDETIKAKGQQSIQLVKAYAAEELGFSVVSNIQKMSEDSGRQGDKWEYNDSSWQAGLPSQKDLMMEKLSQFFNTFRPSGDYWVKFTYKNKAGSHEAMWDVNIYTKKVTPKNDVAKSLSPAATPKS